MTGFRKVALALAIAPLALGLSACKKEAADSAGLSGEPIAKIAAPAGKSWADTVSVTPEGGYLMGNPNAPIKMIEYGALSCSHCAEFSEKGSAELRDSFVASGRVSYELRFFMLNQLDVPAVQLATCGGSPEAVIPLSEQFWAWQKTMFQNLQAAGQDKMQAVSQLPPAQRFGALAQLAGMDQFFAARGIAADQAKACLADVAKAERLVATANEQGQKYDITGTPTFFVNGKKLDMNTWEAIKPELERLGAR